MLNCKFPKYVDTNFALVCETRGWTGSCIVGMKTKVICILLLTFFFFAKENWLSCVCTNPVQQSVSYGASKTSIEIMIDECFDCGHSKTCCFEKTYSEIALAEFGFGEEIELPTTTAEEYVPHFPLTTKASDRFLNKAPPEPFILLTPISLHQKLSV